jgi:hypothetical protein
MALLNTLVIVLIGIALCFVLIGLDRLARRWTRPPSGPAQTTHGASADGAD